RSLRAVHYVAKSLRPLGGAGKRSEGRTGAVHYGFAARLWHPGNVLITADQWVPAFAGTTIKLSADVPYWAQVPSGLGWQRRPLTTCAGAVLAGRAAAGAGVAGVSVLMGRTGSALTGAAGWLAAMGFDRAGSASMGWPRR